MDNSQNVARYLGKLSEKLITGQAGEHAYRPPLEELLQSIFPNFKIVNDPGRSKFGAPDFIILNGEIPLVYIETKDVDANLNKVENSEQIERYRGYPKLIVTNYLEFRFYRDGEPYGEDISIGTLNGTTVSFHDNVLFDLLIRDLSAFLELKSQTITSAEKLAKIMGGRARRLRDNIILFSRNPDLKNKTLVEQYDVFKRLLIHDLTVEQFADMYAQTLVYGLFVARYSDNTPESFNRYEAQELIPKSNPFLRQFFNYIAGPEFDKRLDYIVSDLCGVFSAADVKIIMQTYYKQYGLWGEKKEFPDPVIHFYEDFLREYDPVQRVERGVFYTPLPVVRFIVSSVDQILKDKFNILKGLVDTSKIPITVSAQGHTKSGANKKVKKDVHRVQILDPAVGTGTFLNEVIHKIHNSFSGQEGAWPAYVNEQLLPRLFGFELMIASYTIAHLKLGITLMETGTSVDSRLEVYLTNSLEKAGEIQSQLNFGLVQSITDESIGASRIKEEMPIMVVLGNPPYSGVSQNKEYTDNNVYKFEPGGRQKLKERNSKWLNDDYVKFIRFAEKEIEKTGEGVMAMITAHGYLNNPTFRGMRWHLMQTFDEVYILDLHGNSNKLEKTRDGSSDQNVFDIKTGVAVILAIKTGKKGPHDIGKLFHTEVFGKRNMKYDWLDNNSWNNVEWKEILTSVPDFYFIPFNNEDKALYNAGISIAELFPIKSVGIVTARDQVLVQHTKGDMQKVINDFRMLSTEELRSKYKLGKDVRDWSIAGAKADLNNFSEENIIPIAYRPFDIRWTYYTPKSRGFLCMPRGEVMPNYIKGKNYGLMFSRQVKTDQFRHALVHSNIVESSFVSNKTSEIGYSAPLYIFDEMGMFPNLKKEIVKEIEQKVGKVLDPLDIFDYCYAWLYSPAYREKFKEFLKTDFPCVPFPKNEKHFTLLAQKGKELRLLHLLESVDLNHHTSTFPVVGGNCIDQKYPKYKEQNIQINDSQYFGNVPMEVWNFTIGGYRPAQKWLKDRQGTILNSDEIIHYQKIIKSLNSTISIMKDIDNICQI